jgi:hypothetical protein
MFVSPPLCGAINQDMSDTPYLPIGYEQNCVDVCLQ